MLYKHMTQYGFTNFFINGAGDIRAHSSRHAPRQWRIGIRNPFTQAGTPAGVINISDGAVATSGDYERYVTYREKKYHHIIDARDARIREDVVSVTVLARCPDHRIRCGYAL